ncbi:hypothetical protein O6H91_06G009100 [Diphasiastrum complanatum]|uniref:Uncharacterized protein n=1 Tax=Diphasiastrum complanatum TaxID=34168 RepID=A0ACC2DBE6_DIPCM|nr:hypothetical protein O6H91_06G009100 [Diphasiastrum complanatum]
MALEKKKKLLVLDVNGLLLDTYFYRDKDLLPPQPPDATIGNFFVYKRPFCDEFLEFCLENFVVGVWSSARKHNVDNLVDYIFQGAKDQLAFMWADCTNTGLKHPENMHKPVFLKELSKLWEKLKSSLHLEAGEYGPSNTLLVDDSPYKALRNPPHTAIFPRPYKAHDLEDFSLNGVLRKYLEGLCKAVDVQSYVKQNPFGEPSITAGSLFWEYYNNALKLDNVHCENLIDSAQNLDMGIKTPSENAPGLNIVVSQKQNLEHTQEKATVQVEVGLVDDNEKAKTEWVHYFDAANNSLSTSDDQASVQTLLQTDAEDHSLDRNLRGKQGRSICETTEQARKLSKLDYRTYDGRIKCKRSGNNLPNKVPRLLGKSLHASYHENSQERNIEHSKGSWGGICGSSQKLPLQEDGNCFNDGNSFDERNHPEDVRWHNPLLRQAQTAHTNGDELNLISQRESFYRESQLCQKGKIKESAIVSSTPNWTPRYDTIHRHPRNLDAYNGRVTFGAKDLTYAPASSDIFSGYSDGKGRFYPSRGSDVHSFEVHANQGMMSTSMHKIRYSNRISGYSDESFDMCQNRSRESDRRMQHTSAFMESSAVADVDPESAELFHGAGKHYTYGASKPHQQNGPFRFANSGEAPPTSEHSSSITSEPHPPHLGLHQPSRCSLGDGEQCFRVMADDKEYWRKGSNSTISASNYTLPPKLLRQPNEGHLFPGKFPFENGSGGHQYKDQRNWQYPGMSYVDSRSVYRHHSRR